MTTGTLRISLLTMTGLLAALSATAHPTEGDRSQARQSPPVERPAGQDGLDWRLDRWLTARTETSTSDPRWSQGLLLERRGDQARLEIQPQPGASLSTVTARLLREVGAEPIVRGRDRLDAWVPIDRIRGLAAHSAVGHIGPPHRPVPTAGAIEPVGVTLTGADRFHCSEVRGAGVTVAVLDANLGGFDLAQSSGELPVTVDVPNNLGGTGHGTACAEIVADMAPGAAVRPVRTETLAALQYFVGTLPFETVDIISQSEMYLGLSFGNSAGPICEAVDDAREEGAVWVASEGNIWPGQRWLGTWSDEDGDGWHDFADGDEILELDKPSPSSLSINLDWNDYETHLVDLDVHLYRWEINDWVLVASGEAANGPLVDPFEDAALTGASSGTYGISIFGQKPPTGTMAMRILVLGDDKDTLEETTPGASYDPASCANTVTTGAVDPGQWETGPASTYSGHGPTTDGRTKPVIMGPATANTVSMGSFTGTSAATPHVAGALALVIESTGASAIDSVGVLLNDAIPMAEDAPNNHTGWGRLALDTKHTSWSCQSGETGACATSCGSEGSAICSATCSWGSCEAPEELCSGQDDDCDGATDEGFDCPLGSEQSCTNACGGEGVSRCEAGCQFGACELLEEQCDGVDQDCDEEVDEGFSCALGATQACATSCSSAGTQACLGGCEWGACEPPEERCGGGDEDCDGAIDEGLSCDSGGCQAGGSGRGDVWLWLLGLALLGGIRRARTARFL